MVAVVASAVLAFVGNKNRQHLETAVTRHFEMITRLNSLLTLLLNAETGLRGSLLTTRAEFLEPFAQAQSSLPQEIHDLRSFVVAEPGDGPRTRKLARLEQIEGTVQQEMELLVRLRNAHGAPSTGTPDDQLPGQLMQSKALMDSLRSRLHEMQGEEKDLLGQRLTEIEHIRRRDYCSIAVALFFGLATRGIALWLFNRRVVSRVEKLIANVRALPCGETLPHPASDHHDAIGKLEQEVQRVRSRLPV